MQTRDSYHAELAMLLATHLSSKIYYIQHQILVFISVWEKNNNKSCLNTSVKLLLCQFIPKTVTVTRTLHTEVPATAASVLASPVVSFWPVICLKVVWPSSPSSVVRTTGFPEAKGCRNMGTRVDWNKAPSGNDTSEKGKNSYFTSGLYPIAHFIAFILLLTWGNNISSGAYVESISHQDKHA